MSYEQLRRELAGRGCPLLKCAVQGPGEGGPALRSPTRGLQTQQEGCGLCL